MTTLQVTTTTKQQQQHQQQPQRRQYCFDIRVLFSTSRRTLWPYAIFLSNDVFRSIFDYNLYFWLRHIFWFFSRYHWSQCSKYFIFKSTQREFLILLQGAIMCCFILNCTSARIFNNSSRSLRIVFPRYQYSSLSRIQKFSTEVR